MTHPALRTVAALTTGLILMAGTAPALAQTVPPPESAAQAAALQARGKPTTARPTPPRTRTNWLPRPS